MQRSACRARRSSSLPESACASGSAFLQVNSLVSFCAAHCGEDLVCKKAFSFGEKSSFEFFASRRSAGLAQPLVAPREHRGDEGGCGLDVVVEVGEDSFDLRRQIDEGPRGGLAVVLARLLDDRRLG